MPIPSRRFLELQIRALRVVNAVRASSLKSDLVDSRVLEIVEGLIDIVEGLASIDVSTLVEVELPPHPDRKLRAPEPCSHKQRTWLPDGGSVCDRCGEVLP
jgi:hypothetical protein